MDIRCRCSACQAKFKVAVRYAGKKARCPKCQQIVDVPLQSLEGSTVTSFPALGAQQPAAPGPGISNSTLVPPRSAAPSPTQSGVFARPPTGAASLPPTPGSTGSEFPKFNLSASKPAAGSTAAPTPATSGHRKSNPLPLIIGGGIAAAVLVGIGIVAVIAFSRPAGGKPAPQGNVALAANSTDATLVIDWSDDERRGFGLAIDGRKEPIPSSGEIKFILAPGPHRLLLQRRGFEPIDESVTLTRGKSQHFTPAWKSSAIAAPTPPAGPATSAANNKPAVSAANASATDFPVGTAIASLAPAGFEGWLQNLEVAGKKATAEKKEVLVVFGCSDDSPATRELAQVLQRGNVKALIEPRFVPVVIDFPRTRAGYDLIQDSAQNDWLQKRYAIHKVPVLALLDEHTRPYFIERKWDDGFENVQELINAGQQQRAQRDRLLAAVASAPQAERLAAAEETIQWLSDHKLIMHYAAERQAWLALARQADPENASGRLEKFLEPDWLSRIGEAAQDDDKPAILAAVRELDPWFARKFVDQDRGARLHMIAAQILATADESDQATRHLEQAATYQPADKDLREALAGFKLALQNKDVRGSGSGFLIAPAGYVLTNHHVIEGEGRIEIRVPGTRDTVPAELVAQDADQDMALLKVALPSPEKYRALAVVGGPIRRGAAVAAFGYPKGDELGMGLKFTGGTVSALPDESNEGMYLLDLTVNPGNSGGPLCDRHGNVVGMITKKTANLGFEDSYALAVPAADLLKFLDQHMPADVSRVAASAEAANLDWDQVDEKVSSGVLMILKKK